MKKILLSCVTCLLALGLVTACNNEDEEPNEPEVPGTVVDEGGSDTTLETVKTGKLGLLQESLYSYYYFTGEINSSGFGVGTADYSEAADVTLSKEGTDYYLAVSVDGGTKYIGCPDTSKSAMALYDEPVALTYNDEYDAIVTGDGEEFLCTFGSYTTFSWSSVKTYLGKEGEYIAHIYSSAQTNPTAPELPEPAEWEVGESYLFGVNLTSEIQYIDGGTVSGYAYEGTLTSNASKAVHVTVGEADDDNAYTLSFELSGETYYVTIITTGEGDDIHTNLSYSTEEAPIYWNETYGCWGNEEETHFLCYNSSYKCLYCSEIETWISSSPIAALYEITVLPAPTEMSITGPDIVYVGYTAQLAVEVDEGADASVTWSIAAADGSATEAATIDEETGVVHGVSEVEGLVVTATSAVEECDLSATATIDVLPIVDPNVGTDTTYKLGAKDEANYEYRWFTGSTTGSTFLATSTSYNDGVDVYITGQGAQNDSSDTSCTLSFVDSENQLKYICNNNSATSVTIEDNPCIWVYDETNGVFAMGTNLNTTSGGDRFLCYYATTPSFRAYAGTTSNLNNYPHVTAYASEPEAMEKPGPAYDMTLVTSLQSGSEYYLAYFNDLTGEYYFFDGNKVGSNDYYLSCSTDIESAAKVTVTSADSDKWTLTFSEGESTNTLEGWVNTNNEKEYAEITYFTGTSTHNGVTSFNWNSTYNTMTINLTVSSTPTEYYLEYNQYNGTDEIQLNGISYITSTGKAFQLFTLNESDPS